MRVKQLPWAWVITLLLILIDGVWSALAHIEIIPGPVMGAGIFVVTMLVLHFVYSRLRPDPRLAALTDYTAKLTAYSVALGLFGYLTVTLNQPLIDAQLSAADQAAGFDWVGIYNWVAAHPVIRKILIAAYDSVVPQLGILMTLMVTFRRYDRAQFLLWAYIVSSLTYVIVAAFFPAAGAFGFYRVALDTPYVQQFYALRDGTLRALDLLKLQGVVQFPSFHLALAVLCAYVTRGMRILFPVFLALNIVVIAATPPIGGHFLADLIGGGVLVVGMIYLVERGQKARFQPISGR